MKLITDFEYDMLTTIIVRYPHTLDTCMQVYLKVKSFDKTIDTLNYAAKNGLCPIMALSLIKKTDTKLEDQLRERIYERKCIYSFNNPEIIVTHPVTRDSLVREILSNYSPNMDVHEGKHYQGLKIIRSTDIKEGIFKIY